MIQTMHKRKSTITLKRTAAAPELVQQKKDFTAEGAPPPGLVAGHVPATADAPQPEPAQPADTRIPPSA